MRKWLVEYDFVDGKPMTIKFNFATEEEANAWAEENTTDGKVMWYEKVW